MTQQEVDDLVREQVKGIAEDAAVAIRHIITIASAQIQCQIVSPLLGQMPMNLGVRSVPGDWEKDQSKT